MAKSENVLSEDGQAVEVKYPGESLQDQDKRERIEESGDRPVGTSTAGAPAEPDKDLEKVREIRRQNELRAGTHGRTEVHRNIVVQSKDGGTKDADLELHAYDGRVIVKSHGDAYLDREGLLQLRNFVDAAVQAVS